MINSFGLIFTIDSLVLNSTQKNHLKGHTSNFFLSNHGQPTRQGIKCLSVNYLVPEHNCHLPLGVGNTGLIPSYWLYASDGSAFRGRLNQRISWRSERPLYKPEGTRNFSTFSWIQVNIDFYYSPLITFALLERFYMQRRRSMVVRKSRVSVRPFEALCSPRVLISDSNCL